MSNPKISVIIPVYNVEQYLRECLDSVVNQTFRDIEIICVNDGSTDGSQAILEEYAAKDSRIVTLYQTNAGQAAARNKALDIAKGDFILFVDSDDAISLETIEKTYNAALESGSEMVMFYLHWDDPDFPVIINAPCDISKPVEDLLSKTKLALFQGPGPCKWLWKRTVIDRLNLRFPEGIKFEDVPFVINAALHSNHITVVPSQLYYWRLQIGSTTRQKNDFYCRYACLTFQYALESVQDLHLSDECLQAIYQNKLLLIWRGYYNWTPKELLRQFRNVIRNNALPHEYEWIKTNKICLSHSQRFFYFGVYGNRIAQAVTFLKMLKESLADWFAKRLAPHSPWLQRTLDSVDYQRKLILEQLEQLNNQKNE